MCSETTTMRAVLADGERSDAIMYDAVERDGVLHLAASAYMRGEPTPVADAIQMARRKRWCPAAQKAMQCLETWRYERERDEVERILGVPSYAMSHVIVRGRDVYDKQGTKIATLD